MAGRSPRAADNRRTRRRCPRRSRRACGRKGAIAGLCALAAVISMLPLNLTTPQDRDDEVFLGIARLRGMECRAPYAEAFYFSKLMLAPSVFAPRSDA